ncbi:hypothetical protein J122_2280 [Marinobacter excellens LAMA 842]|uniref:Uncharacterized protein n=1 Tax=Marinobacter excellens LAMA 842 TaxID=1306954 RepID=A0A137SB93_9GAMM|nr:hypothetical protein J122_2280 [Marinobacter excellens LAMA 842]
MQAFRFQRGAGFLSCLYGSEVAGSPWYSPIPFLSCLYGSEGVDAANSRAADFLSCLYGSEEV